MHSVTRTIFPVFAFKVTHRVILLTWCCKLLTRVATLSRGGGTCLKCLNGTKPLHPRMYCQFQYTYWLDPEDEPKNIYALDMAVSDSQFTCPLNRFARRFASVGLPVYAYYFTERFGSNPWPDWMGVLHGDEIFFVFGEPIKFRHNFTDAERSLSRQMIAYWTNFAKTGSVSTPISCTLCANGGFQFCKVFFFIKLKFQLARRDTARHDFSCAEIDSVSCRVVEFETFVWKNFNARF